MKNVHVMGCLLGALLCGCGPKAVQVTINPDNNSGQSGFATITDNGNKTVTVVIETSVPDFDMPQNAHIHPGTCGEVGVAAGALGQLKSLGNGRWGSTSDAVMFDFDKLKTGDWVLNVHDARDTAIYVACGVIPRP